MGTILLQVVCSGFVSCLRQNFFVVIEMFFVVVEISAATGQIRSFARADVLSPLNDTVVLNLVTSQRVSESQFSHELALCIRPDTWPKVVGGSPRLSGNLVMSDNMNIPL